MPAIQFKPGVNTPSMHPAIEHALNIASLIWEAKFSVPLIVTSLNDGKHSSRSFHFGRAGDIRCMAADLRSRTLTTAEKDEAVDLLTFMLGGAYDVILESNHIHIELDPDLPQ